MRSQLKFITLCGALIVMASSMAVVYKLIPVQAAALISVMIVVVIAAIVSRGPTAASGAPPKQKAGRVWGLILPLLLGASVGMFGAWREGWKLGDTIGAIVCFLLLAGYLSVYRKQRGRVSGS